MKVAILASLALQGAMAFPSSLQNHLDKRMADPDQNNFDMNTETEMFWKREAMGFGEYYVTDEEVGIHERDTPAQTISKARTNCGAEYPTGCLEFSYTDNAVSITGQHAYASPAPDEIRGPCPGLNSAANHAYLPRNGIATIPETIDGLGAAFGMSTDLAGFLAAYAIAFDGDLITQTWSIGGPPPAATLGKGILGKPQGISYSHNKYEGDTSISRGDAYINNGDAHSLQLDRYRLAYAATDSRTPGQYSLDAWSQLFAKNTVRSIKTNPYYFAPLFSTTLVSPAAYNFVINMMSNHTEENKSGYLDGHTFKKFFAVAGDTPDTFVWKRGQERIPVNWYRRTRAQPYTAVGGVFGDLAAEFAAYPHAFRFGGNTNGVKTYTGIDLENFTGGAFTASNLFQGNNLACFFFQNQQQAVPDELKGGVNDIAGATALITKFLSPFASLTCPQLGKYDNSVFNKYPGRTYSPTGPATNY